MRFTIALVALALAGCAQPSAPTAESAEAGAPPAAVRGIDVEMPVPSLQAPPDLLVGEWWLVEFASPMSGDTYQAKVVVANVTPEGYVFGLPHETWSKEAVAYHSPGLGDVGRDFGYQVHNERFQPLSFPLREGATWSTTWLGARLDARVLEVQGLVAQVGFFPPAGALPSTGPPAPSFTLTYNATLRGIESFSSGLSEWRVLDHGLDFEGWVTVPRNQVTVFDDSRLGPAGPDDAWLEQEVRVEGDFNRLTVMHMIMAMGPGDFQINNVAPSGQAFQSAVLGGPDHLMQIFEAADPTGTWLRQERALGAGSLYTMGIAYNQYDIHVPDGATRGDHSHGVER